MLEQWEYKVFSGQGVWMCVKGSCALVVTKTPVLMSSSGKKKENSPITGTHSSWNTAINQMALLKYMFFGRGIKFIVITEVTPEKMLVVNSQGTASTRHLWSLWLIGRLADWVGSPADYFHTLFWSHWSITFALSVGNKDFLHRGFHLMCTNAK